MYYRLLQYVQDVEILATLASEVDQHMPQIDQLEPNYRGMAPRHGLREQLEPIAAKCNTRNVMERQRLSDWVRSISHIFSFHHDFSSLSRTQQLRTWMLLDGLIVDIVFFNSISEALRYDPAISSVLKG